MTEKEALVILFLDDDMRDKAWEMRKTGEFIRVMTRLRATGHIRTVPVGDIGLEMVPTAEAIAEARTVLA